MKFFLKLFTFVLLFAVGFSSCKKEARSNARSIEGKWYFTEYKVSGFKNGIETVGTYYHKETFNNEYYISFDGQNSGEQYVADPFYKGYENFTYTFSNSVLTIKPMLYFTKHSGFNVTKVSDNEMTLTVKLDNTDGSYELEVLRLNK